MLTRIVLMVAVSLFMVPGCLQAQDGKAEMVAAERKVWDAFAADPVKVKAVLEEMFAPECVLQMYGMAMTRDQDIAQSGSLSEYGYTMEDVKVQELSPTSGYVTARVKWHGMYEGKPLQGDDLTSTLWMKRAGKWVELMHTQMAVMKMAG